MVDCWNNCLENEGLGGDNPSLAGKSFCDGADDALECAFDCTPKEFKGHVNKLIMTPWKENEEAMCNQDDAPCKDHELCQKVKDENYKGDDEGEEKELGTCMTNCLNSAMPSENQQMSAAEFCGGLEDGIGCEFDCVPEEVDASDAILAPFLKQAENICGETKACSGSSLCDKLAEGGKGFQNSRLYDARVKSVTRKIPPPPSMLFIVSGDKAEQTIKQWTAAFTRGPMPSAGFLAMCAVMGFLALGGTVFAWRRSMRSSTDATLIEVDEDVPLQAA